MAGETPATRKMPGEGSAARWGVSSLGVVTGLLFIVRGAATLTVT